MTAKFLTRSAIPGKELASAFGEVLRLSKRTVENFVLSHAIGVPVATEADYDEALLFGHDGLVDVPAGDEMRKYDGSHGCGCSAVVSGS